MVRFLKHFVLLNISFVVICWSCIAAVSLVVNFACSQSLQSSVVVAGDFASDESAVPGSLLRISAVIVDENSDVQTEFSDLTKLVCRDFLFMFRNERSMERKTSYISITNAGLAASDKYLSDYYTIGLLKIMI